MSDVDQVDLDDPELFMRARAVFATKVDGRKAARKSRQQQLSGAVDGRSLRATGRTELVNFRATARIKALVKEHVPQGKISAWFEEAILAKLKSDGVDTHA